MTTVHNPSDETLFAYASGNLAAAESLVVATHLALAPASRRLVDEIARLGGLLLEDLPPVPMGAHALARALARIEAPQRTAPRVHADPADAALPAPILEHGLGPWKWAGLGTHVRRVETPEDGGSRAIMFRIEPGRKMPQHTHSGREFTCVISGSYSDESGRYGPGDFEEADEEVSHRPVVDSDVPCICIVALTGAIRLEGALGRMLQPFVRI